MSDMEIKVILEEANVNKDFFTSNRKENNLKCPFCQQELEEDYLDVQLFGCENQNCKHWINNDIIGTKELWQELIRTRKALEIIKKEMSKETMPDFAVIRDALKGVSDE